MNDLMALAAQWWWVGLIILTLGWVVPHIYWEIERRRNPVKAQFIVTLGCLVVLYYGAGIMAFFFTILACLKHLFFR